MNTDKIKAIQRILQVTDDGIFGPRSKAALEAVLAKDEPENPITIPGVTVDDRSEKNIATLLPEVRNRARQLIWEAAKAGFAIKIISGTRTYAEQDALYAKGRTAPGPKVTNARGGQSNHNFSIAFDIGVFKDGKYLEDGPEYKKVGAIGKALGFKWGGDWDGFKDEPHFEWNPKGYSVADLRERKAAGLPLV